MLRTRDHLLLDEIVEEGPEIIIEPIEIGLFFWANNRFAIRVLGRKHRGELRTRSGGTWFCCESGGGNQKHAENDRDRSHVAFLKSDREMVMHEIAIATAATTTEIRPASRYGTLSKPCSVTCNNTAPVRMNQRCSKRQYRTRMTTAPAARVHHAQTRATLCVAANSLLSPCAPMSQPAKVRKVKNKSAAQPRSLKAGDGLS